MEKTEITVETIKTIKRSVFGRVLSPPKTEDGVAHKQLKLHGKEAFLCLLGLLWGNTTVFQILNPFGLAFLSAFFAIGPLFYPVALSVAVGMWIHGGADSARYIGYVLFCVLLQWGAAGRLKNPSTMVKAAFGGLATLLAGLAFAAFNGGSFFYMWVAAIEGASVFLLTFVCQRGITLSMEGLRRRILTAEEMISLSLLAGGAVAGSAGVIVPWIQIPLMAILAPLLILTAGFRGGAGTGAAAGVLIGFLLLVCDKGDLSVFCALSLGGFLSGSMKEIGRVATAFGFFAAMVLLLFYQNNALLDLNFIKGMVIGVVGFMLIPRPAFAFINTYAAHEKEFHEDTYFIKMKELIEERLGRFAAAFNGLGKTFKSDEIEQQQNGRQNIAGLIDTIADKACKNCGLSAYCWESDFYHTYQVAFSALSCCERRGFVSAGSLPEEFQKSCVRLSSFVETVNHAYEQFQLLSTWRHKMTECRELVSQQLFAVGNIIEDLSGQLDVRGVFLETMEKELAAAFDKANITVDQITVMDNQSSKRGLQVIIMMKSCSGGSKEKLCNEKLIPIASKTLGKPMRKIGGKAACYSNKDKQCTLRLIEEQKYRLTTAVASRPKEEGDLCGDNTAYLETTGGTAIMALSDGMGTGKEANAESKSAIELLEQFMEAGFQKELAVKMINSALLLGTGEESFATLDICSVDLYTAKAEFMKIGAAAAYILREGRVIAIRSQTLPAGILQQISPDKNDMMLKSGDMILLMTDGMTDAIGGTEGDVQWLTNICELFYSSNPQVLAQYLLQEAQKKLSEGRRDDMTVMAGRFWQK